MFKYRFAFAQLLLLIFFCFSPFVLYAQMDCRSMLGAYVSPIGESNFSWGIEATIAPGIMKDRQIANGLLILGADYSSPSGMHQFYVEGGYKNFYNSAKGPGVTNPGEGTGYKQFPLPEKNNFGLREAFYKLTLNNSEITTGIQSIKLNDFFMVDERSLGVTFNTDYQAFTLKSHIGTVMNDFARMADFCGTRHMFNLVRGGRFGYFGENIGEANFFGATISFDPHYEKQDISTNGDEFGDAGDEFGEFESKSKTKPIISLEDIGIIYYQEFGEVFHDYRYYGGLFAEFGLPMETKFKVEPVFQYLEGEHSLAYYLRLEKSKIWDNGSLSDIQLGYVGKVSIQEKSHFYPSYSNLFYGEVWKLDVLQMPLSYFSISHRFTGKAGFHIKLFAVTQLQEDKSNEIDLITSFKLLDHAKISLIAGMVNSKALDEMNYLLRSEIRIAF